MIEWRPAQYTDLQHWLSWATHPEHRLGVAPLDGRNRALWGHASSCALAFGQSLCGVARPHSGVTRLASPCSGYAVAICVALEGVESRLEFNALLLQFLAARLAQTLSVLEIRVQ